MKAIQEFSKEYLEYCKTMTPGQILQFLEDFRLLQGVHHKNTSITLELPESLLENFKQACLRSGEDYQTQIKKLMLRFLGTREEHGL